MSARIFNLITIIGVLALASACTSKRQLSQQDIQKIFPDKPAGAFKAYSAKELKKLKLTSNDFSADVSVPTAIDPRLTPDMIEQHQKKYLLTSGVFEWNERVSVQALSKKSVSLLHKGQLLHHEKGSEVSKVVDCNEETIQLSSGVVQRELKCGQLSVIEEAQELDAEITSCQIQLVGTRPIKTTSVFGRMTLKDDGRKFSRVTKETKIISGEVICDGDNLGMGSETRITYYSNEEPNVSYPAVGSHKVLFQSRAVVKSNGVVVYKSSDEITAAGPIQLQASNKKPSRNESSKIQQKNSSKKKVRVANKKRGKRVVSM